MGSSALQTTVHEFVEKIYAVRKNRYDNIVRILFIHFDTEGSWC